MTTTWKTIRLHHGIRAITGGQGPPIILLAGWPQTAEAFSNLFHPLSKNHQFFALDPPGLGSSDPPKTYDTASISKTMAEAIHSTLKPDEPYHLLGHDIGGWIAYPWAAQYPARIKSLSILDASVPGFLPRFTFPLSNADNLRLWQFSFHALPELPEILITGKEREFLTWFFQRKTARKDVLDRFEEYIEVYERPGALSRSFEYYRAYEVSAKQNLEFARRFLQIPVMALGGEASVGEGMVGLVKGFVDGRMVEGGAIGECGHFLPEEQPDAVVERVMEFLGRNE